MPSSNSQLTIIKKREKVVEKKIKTHLKQEHKLEQQLTKLKKKEQKLKNKN